MKECIVLISVLKEKKDLDILLKKHWYRIPLIFAPKRKTKYIAFYQPASFGKYGGCIKFYALIKNCKIIKRRYLLPDEYDHPMANEDYYKIYFKKIWKLQNPILNKNRMRISFGFTTLEKLFKAKNIAEVFDVWPIEEIIFSALKKRGINFSREHIFYLKNGKKYRLDFAVFCKRGYLNIECDSDKWHSQRSQRIKDYLRDKTLEKEGWTILRLSENEITKNIKNCIHRIEENIKKMEVML